MSHDTQELIWVVAWGISTGLIMAILYESWFYKRFRLRAILYLTALLALALACFVRLDLL
jgi:hypothetical protein